MGAPLCFAGDFSFVRRLNSRMAKEKNHTDILLVGAGKMGGALLAAWTHKYADAYHVTVLEKDEGQAKTASASGARVVSSFSDAGAPDCIVLAVKPQSMEEILTSLRPRLNKHSPESQPLFLSIAAGKTLAYFKKHLGDAPVVRAMPNTPALVRKGITALCASASVTEVHKRLAATLLEAAGEVVWLEDESLMDAVTAVSGSGPAYVFLFLDALVAAGVKQGLPEPMARKLAMQTLRGSVKLAMKSEESLEQLRKNVTSPGGTTEAALKVLMKEDRFQSLIDDAVKAAVKRAKELA